MQSKPIIKLPVRNVCANLNALSEALKHESNRKKPLFWNEKVPKSAHNLVLLIDIDGSNLNFQDFLDNDLKSQLQALRNQGLSLCIVTNKNLQNISSDIENLKKVIKADCFDLIVDNPLDAYSKDPQPTTTSKVAILSMCRSACPEGTEFCYFGSNSELCNFVNMNLRLYTFNLQSQTKEKLPDAQDLKNSLALLLKGKLPLTKPTQEPSRSRLPPATSHISRIPENSDGAAQTFEANNSNKEVTQAKISFRGKTQGPVVPPGITDILSEDIVISPKKDTEGRRLKAAQEKAPETKRFPEELLKEAGIGKDDHTLGRITEGDSKNPAAQSRYSNQHQINSRHQSRYRKSTDQMTQDTSVSGSHASRGTVNPPTKHAPKAHEFSPEQLNELKYNVLVPPAAEIATLPFQEWFRKYFLKSPLISDPSLSRESSAWNKIKETLKNFFSNLFLGPFRALILIYGFDGYDLITNTINYADKAKGDTNPEPYEGNTITAFSPKLFLASFFGLPSRPIKGIHGGPTITWKQIGKNFLGGIDWEDHTPYHKKLLQIFGSPVKLGILLLKILTFPFKLAINILKLATEFIPWIASSLSYFFYNLTKLLTQASWWGLKKAWSKGLPALPFIIILAITTPALALSTVALVATHFACRLLMIIGRAITSPENGLRIAYASVSELKLPFESEVVRRRMAKFLGGLAATMSIAITIVTWAIFFPLLINFVANFVPIIASWVTAVLNWQPIATIITGINVPFTAVTGFLHSVIGPAIAALTQLIGVQITITAIVTAVLTPMVVGWGYFINYLSNRWNNWNEGGLFGSDDKISKLYPLPTTSDVPQEEKYKYQSSSNHRPSPGVTDLRNAQKQNDRLVRTDNDYAVAHAEEVERGSTFPSQRRRELSQQPYDQKTSNRYLSGNRKT